MTLEEAITEAAARGLTHLSLAAVPSNDRKTTYWSAVASPSTAHRHVSATSKDPIQAVMEVLADLPKARRNTKSKSGGLTATVIAEAAEAPDAEWLLKA